MPSRLSYLAQLLWIVTSSPLAAFWHSSAATAEEEEVVVGKNYNPPGSEIGEFYDEIGFYQSIKATPLLRRQSKYQAIEIYQSKHYGKILVLGKEFWRSVGLTGMDCCFSA